MAEKLPFEKLFPYFSYRWRYDDGQYSPYAPFTQAQFMSKKSNTTDFFKNGHNTSVANDLKVINLKSIPRGGPDVVAIDILYSESISSTVYVFKTIDIPKSKRGNGGYESIQITERSFGAALSNDQLNRHFDNVPRVAKAQEVTANRLMYGNYKQKFNYNEPLKIEVSTQLVPQPENGPSVKTNRLYEVGVAYLDRPGRLGGLQTQKTVDQANQGSAFNTAFSYTNRIALAATIKSEYPAWASFYRYYVKDVSGEHFNLSAFNVYNDGTVSDVDSDNVYLQFNSSDRNKISDDTILIPKHYSYDDVNTAFTEESRHPVLDIENEAPDIVKNQVNERTSILVTSFIESNGRILGSASGEGGPSTTGTTSELQTTIYISDESPTFATQARALNSYIASNDPDETVVFDVDTGGSSADKTDQLVDVSDYPDKLMLRFKPATNSDDTRYKTEFNLVESITFLAANSHSKRNVFKFVLGERVDENGTVLSGIGLSKGGHTLHHSDPTMNMQLYKLGLSEEGQDKLKGSFFVKIPRQVLGNTGIDAIPPFQTEFDEDGKVTTIKEISFETEPIDESSLDLYWESGDTYPISMHGKKNVIQWSNCIATLNNDVKTVTLESKKIFDKFNTVSIAQGTRVLTPEPRYAEETRKSGLIFSGLYNSKTGINELNQFNDSLGITKELEPNSGGIQKLYTLDTNLLAFCEDKVFRILADKDALFNADDGVNVVATNRVLGQAMSYQGNYGISTHPESLVYFNNQLYFTDAKRGVVMQLTPANGQLFPISSNGMSNFFRDRIGTADKLIGMYDGAKKLYTLSMQGYNTSDASIGTESISGETETTSQVTLPDYNTGLIYVDNNAGQTAGEMLITGPGYSSGTGTPIDLTTISAANHNILTFNFPTEEKANSFRTAIGWPDSGVTTAGSSIGPFTISFSGGQKIVITQPAGNLSTNSGRTVVIGNNDAGTLNNPIYGIGSGIVTPISGWPAAVTSSLGDFGGVSTSVSTSAGGLTLGYSFRAESWPSRYSFIPESGLTVGNKFYTFKNGKVYVHGDDTANRNTFYGTAYNSEVEVIINDEPSSVKEFLTLSYEGSSGWTVSSIDTESNDTALTSTWPFVKKEDKYFAPIVSQENYYGSTDQSLGSATADDGSTVYVQGTRDKSGIKGFYNKVRLENDSTSKAELFAVNTENFISQT